MELEAGSIEDADVSWDDRWLATATGTPDGTLAIYVLPIAESPAPLREWTLITKSARWVGSPRWSSDGRIIYYLSERDGFTCIWAQPLDPVTKKPLGDAFAVVHAHRSPMKLYGPRGAYSLAVGPDTLAFNAGELTGNVFLADLAGK